MGDSVPQVPLAYGPKVCVRAYGTFVCLKMEVRICRRLGG
jgi:hypothetical protein